MKELREITIKDLIEELRELPQDAKIGTLIMDNGEMYASNEIGITHKDEVNYNISVNMESCEYYLY